MKMRPEDTLHIEQIKKLGQGLKKSVGINTTKVQKVEVSFCTNTMLMQCLHLAYTLHLIPFYRMGCLEVLQLGIGKIKVL